MASLSINSVTSNSIGVYISGLDSSYSRADRYVDWYLGGSLKQTTYLGAYISQSSVVTFTGLSSDTLYTITGRIFYTLVAGGAYSYVDVSNSDTTLSGRPPFFYWTYTKTSGGDFNLKAYEWNDFMDNINLVRTYKGYGQIWYTTASLGYPFTSNMYDQAHSSVNEMYNYMSAQGKSYINSITSTGWNTGQTITANHLNYIVSALNSII